MTTLDFSGWRMWSLVCDSILYEGFCTFVTGVGMLLVQKSRQNSSFSIIFISY